MGSPSSEADRSDDETQHSVTVSSFCMMESEVTQGAWETVMGSNPSNFSSCGSTCPVEQVSWDDIQVFIKKVNKRDGVQYRLPTEAEWEYAARGGQSFLYSGSESLSAVGWYSENSSNQPHPICQKRRNGYGLCDMSGNVWEWVSDWYGDYKTSGSTFKADSLVDPQGNASGSPRVVRGGSWYDAPDDARVADRIGLSPSDRYFYLGFRLSRTIP
jgi:sulfatase modifying factor 1